MSDHAFYVTCPCQYCNIGLEFDASGFENGETRLVECPKCHLETVIFVPSSLASKPPRLPDWTELPTTVTSLKSLTLNEANVQPATPKQVAFLKYMGVSNANKLSKQEASTIIEKNSFLNGDRDEISLRMRNWLNDRLELYPDLYNFELREYQIKSLHAYIRQRVVGASETLTKSKIEHVIRTLNDENSSWWKEPNRQLVFAEQLKQMYPGCCDGRLPAAPIKPAALVPVEDSLPEDDGDRPPTQRQIMVLRFWNRLDLEHTSKMQVERWLEDFYRQDSRRKGAWELYKLKNEDDGTRRNAVRG